jgi:hypothetical protein
MEESGSPWGKLLPLLLFLAFAGFQAWFKSRKQKDEKPARVPPAQAPETRREERLGARREEHLSARKTEGSAPDSPEVAIPRRPDDYRLREPTTTVQEAVVVGPVSEGLKRNRALIVLGRKQLRTAVLYHEILSRRHF